MPTITGVEADSAVVVASAVEVAAAAYAMTGKKVSALAAPPAGLPMRSRVVVAKVSAAVVAMAMTKAGLVVLEASVEAASVVEHMAVVPATVPPPVPSRQAMVPPLASVVATAAPLPTATVVARVVACRPQEAVAGEVLSCLA